MKITFTLLFLIFSSFNLRAQDAGSVNKEAVSIHFKTGFSHKTGMGEVLPELLVSSQILSSTDARSPLLYTDEEKNMLGPSLDLGVEFMINPWNTALEYRMGIRHDHLYNTRELNSNFVESVNGLFYEHHFMINQYLGRGRLQPLIMTGLSLLNRGASYQVIAANNELIDYDMQTSAFNFGFGFRFDHFTASFKNYAISEKNNPFYIKNNSGLISPSKGFSVQEISLHYTF